MKKILFTLLLVLGISAAADAQVRFLDSSTDAVRKEAIAQDKLVFIDLYATWCGPCKAMERDVFSKKEVGDFMDEYFVAAKYDIDKPTGKALAGKHGIRSIPTYLVFNTEGDLLGKITGSMPAEEFTCRPSEDHRRNREEIATGGCNKERKRFLYEDRFRSPFPSCSEYDLTSDYSVSCPEILLATDVAPLFPATGTVKFPRR